LKEDENHTSRFSREMRCSRSQWARWAERTYGGRGRLTIH